MNIAKEMEKFPCLASMDYEDVLDFFRVDDKTLEKELEKIAQHPQWISSISDVIVKKIEEMTNKK